MKIALLFSEAKPKEGGSRLSSIPSLPAFAKGVDIGSSEPEGRWTTGMCGRAGERPDRRGRVPDTSRGCSGKGIRRSSWSIPVSSSFKTRWDLPGENIHMRVLAFRDSQPGWWPRGRLCGPAGKGGGWPSDLARGDRQPRSCRHRELPPPRLSSVPCADTCRSLAPTRVASSLAPPCILFSAQNALTNRCSPRTRSSPHTTAVSLSSLEPGVPRVPSPPALALWLALCPPRTASVMVASSLFLCCQGARSLPPEGG